jgi:hypothetical protein
MRATRLLINELEMKRFRLWFKEGTTLAEKLGVWEGVGKRDAVQECLKARDQTIAQRAAMLGISEDRYVNDYVEAEDV